MRFATLFLTLVAFAGSFADPVENHAFLYGFLEGQYLLVGKALENDSTFLGKMVFESRGDHLEVTRIVDQKRVKGTGRIEHAVGEDQVNVLRVRFSESGIPFEATYLWMSDLDNHARLSGYLYRRGRETRSPGMEVLFIDHGAP